MGHEQEKMHEEDEFQKVLKRYEDMLRARKSYFFDVEEFEDIIDYYLDMRDFKHAFIAAEKAMGQHPGSYELKLKLVHTYLESGRAQDALDILEQFVDFEKDDLEYDLLKATALVQISKFREAIKLFDKVIENGKEDIVDTCITISIVFENVRQYNSALKYLKIAYALNNENLTLLYDMAYFHEKLNEFHFSIDFYNKYLDIDPYSENVWYNLGVIYTKTNKVEKAVECYDFALAVNPSYGSAYFNKANIFLNENNFEEAIKTYTDFIEVDPENLQALSFLGDCYEEKKDYESSLEVYQRIIKKNNTYSDGWFGAGIALMNTGKLSEAVTYTLKAIDFDKNNPEYWFSLAEIYEMQKLSDEAKKCYSYVCKLDNQDREAWIRLAFIYINNSDLAGALVVLREGYQSNSHAQDILYLLSAIYFRLNDRNAAFKFLRKGFAQGEGGLKVFYQIYPEGENDTQINKIIK